MKFKTLLCDPPWLFDFYGKMGAKRSPENHYPCQSQDWIKSLPVQAVAAKDCVLLLWTTWPKLAEGLEVVDAWGFTYKSGYPWLKLSRDMLPHMGTGYHARACSEILMIGTKGNPPAPEPSERTEGVLFSRQGRHSAKPESIYERAEFYDGPYLEMFARPAGGLMPLRDGWVQIGNEITGRSIECDLLDLAADKPLPSIVHGVAP